MMSSSCAFSIFFLTIYCKGVVFISLLNRRMKWSFERQESPAKVSMSMFLSIFLRIKLTTLMIRLSLLESLGCASFKKREISM